MVGRGISTSKPVLVPEMQQFIYNTFFVRDLSVKPILRLLSPKSSETDRQTDRQPAIEAIITHTISLVQERRIWLTD